MAKNRNYSCKDVDMLLASKTIAESFRNNIGELSATRITWTEQYAGGSRAAVIRLSLSCH